MALQPRGFLQQLAGWHLGPLLSPAGVALVMGLAIFPVVYFAVSRSMAASGSRLAEAARVFGAGPWRAFFRVTLPLSLPAIGASVLLAFTLAIEEYGVPAALGAQSGVSVLTTAIERRLADWPIDLPGAALLSLVLVVGADRFRGAARAAGRGFETTTGKPALAQAELGPWRLPALLLFALVALAAVAAPLASMLAAALTRNLSGGLSLANLTLANFGALFQARGEAWDALSTSLSLAAGAALLAGAVGLLAAWCVAGRHVPGAPPLTDWRCCRRRCPAWWWAWA